MSREQEMDEFEVLKGILKRDWDELNKWPCPDDEKLVVLMKFHVILQRLIKEYRAEIFF